MDDIRREEFGVSVQLLSVCVCVCCECLTDAVCWADIGAGCSAQHAVVEDIRREEFGVLVQLISVCVCAASV